MDNKTAFWLAFIITGIFVADVVYFEWGLFLIIGKLLERASIWLAFWHKF